MTKSIKLTTIAFVLIASLALAFKSADNDKKDYVSIYFGNSGKDITLSYSNGTFKKVDLEKTQGIGDQTQFLKLINEHEAQGYKLVNYDTKFPVNIYTYVGTALLVK